jgi:pyruvate,water dikinase
VDGAVDPDRWELDRNTREVTLWLPGERDDGDGEDPLLEPRDLEAVLETLLAVESLFDWAPDMEWTGRGDRFTVLQARPITAPVKAKQEDKRDWYLTLRPGDARLRALRERVAGRLIPELEAEAESLANEDLGSLGDRQLAGAIDQRRAAVKRWKKIYWDEFIPFAHGVRRLATYYNDAVRPDDPYEFVGLLRDQPLLAARRNRAIGELARLLSDDDRLRRSLDDLLKDEAGSLDWPAHRGRLASSSDTAAAFVEGFDELCERYLDITYDRERLRDRPEPLLRTILELSGSPVSEAGEPPPDGSAADLEQRLLEAVGADRRDEALEVIETGRVSWKLRDDDNLLVARLESQLLRALGEGAERLRRAGRLEGDGRVTADHTEAVTGALDDPSAPKLVIAAQPEKAEPADTHPDTGESPRQLIGQPASPGVARGRVRCIRGREDLGEFRRGEVLVCDAIQPTMTHLVPLAAAIVERRGGMLIHGAIIARELGIPCVNGVRRAADILATGDPVTVDGHLGIVTVGEPVFDLELGQS